MFDLELERKALYEAITCLDHSQLVTAKQVQALAALVNMGLDDKSRTNRIAVLNYLIGDAVRATLGVEFISFKNISGSIATFLIDMLLKEKSVPWELSDYGYSLLAAVEERVKASLVL